MSLDEYAQAGIKAINEKNFDVAIDQFKKAIEAAPDRPDMNHALGMAHMHRGEAGEAIPYLERAVELAEPYDDPKHQDLKAEFHASLATAYQMMDRLSEARGVLEGMIEEWPDNVQARHQLGTLLLGAGALDDGLAVYESAAEHLDEDGKKATEALTGAIKAFQQSEHTGRIILLGHCESYIEYFDKVAEEQTEKGWYAEAARMAKGEDDDEPKPFVPEGARPYAFMRVDLVDPVKGEVSGVYSEQEPMIVALNGLEPLAQAAILFDWPGHAFDVKVSSQCPWHWLLITIQFAENLDAEARIDAVDETIGEWYLNGYNGEFGDWDSGRFHYITDPEPIGERTLAYTVDLGRARFEAVQDLLKRLTIVHDRQPIEQVVFGQSRLFE